MQGVFSVIVNCSALFVNLYSKKQTGGELWYTDYVGLGVWIIGFAIEYMADR